MLLAVLALGQPEITFGAGAMGACGSGRDGPAAAAHRIRAHTTLGAIEGTVRWAGGRVPPPRRVQNTTDPDVCGKVHEIRRVRVSTTGGLADVIVAVVGGLSAAAGAAVPGPGGGSVGPQPAVLIQNVDCSFRPHVAVAIVGDTVATINRDPMLHTVHFYGAVKENLALPGPGTRAQVRVTEPGLLVLLCDVHGWMQAYVRVDPHRFHAVTQADGRFRIGGLPAGEYELELWHEVAGTLRRTVHVRAGRSTRVDISLGPEPDEGSEP